MMKWLLDVVMSSMAMALLSPLLLAAALFIKLGPPGPVFYRGLRMGRYGRTFRIYKFRTMVANADKIGPPSTAAGDLRITRIGRILRRLNLDELPQFINVLRGEMSIVGPRPEIPDVIALYSEEERAVLLSVRPGITDWATIWIRDEGERLRGSPDPHKKYLEEIWPEKRRLQLKYIREQSLWTDFRIMLLTLKCHLIDRFKKSALPLTSQTQKGRGHS